MRPSIGTVLGASSPRPWGCFWITVSGRVAFNVFPTPVGVFPKGSSSSPMILCLPHARGGVSAEEEATTAEVTSSPRPWGCFLQVGRSVRVISVFPTPVGVFLELGIKKGRWRRLPHARGGVSD